MNAYEVDQAFGDQKAPFRRIVEEFALSQWRGRLGSELPHPFAFFQRDSIFEEEQVVPFQFAREPDRLDGLQPFMHVVAQRDVEAYLAANPVEQLERVAHVLAAVEIHAVRRALGAFDGALPKPPPP